MLTRVNLLVSACFGFETSQALRAHALAAQVTSENIASTHGVAGFLSPTEPWPNQVPLAKWGCVSHEHHTSSTLEA
jgi:hypothetical protein